MKIFNSIFGSRNSNSEKLIEDTYVDKFTSLNIGRREIKEVIAQCKAESKREGTNNLTANFGDQLIEQAKTGN